MRYKQTALGVSLILAALNVRYRNVKYTLPFLIQLWLFVTPVIYPTSIIPERYRFLAALNPLTGVIDTFCASLVPARQIDWQLLGVSSVVTPVVFATAVVYFGKTERTFAEYFFYSFFSAPSACLGSSRQAPSVVSLLLAWLRGTNGENLRKLGKL